MMTDQEYIKRLESSLAMALNRIRTYTGKTVTSEVLNFMEAAYPMGPTSLDDLVYDCVVEWNRRNASGSEARGVEESEPVPTITVEQMTRAVEVLGPTTNTVFSSAHKKLQTFIDSARIVSK